MEFCEVINNRRSIRQFEDKEISKDILERILEQYDTKPDKHIHLGAW